MGVLYIGLISGTSADGVDAALVEFSDEGAPRLVQHHNAPYAVALHADIERAVRTRAVHLDELAALDARIGEAFGHAALSLLRSADVDAAAVSAVGSHGQTLVHHPRAGTSMQLGDPNRIAATTGIPVVADMRRADLAVGGQGAPLAPLFHRAVFSAAGEARAVLNLGGIANISVLDADGAVCGFDVGPANTLMDLWAQRHARGPHDAGGAFAAAGRPSAALLEALRDDAFFTLPPPKSTGREHFNSAWLDSRLPRTPMRPEDVQATLAELTAVTVADALARHGPGVGHVYACGGGVHNDHLMSRVGAHLPAALETTAALGIDPDYVEAMMCAWLARERIFARSPEGLGDVTGARAPAVLGGVWLPPRSGGEG